jgi:hypothetical protein
MIVGGQTHNIDPPGRFNLSKLRLGYEFGDLIQDFVELVFVFGDFTSS